MSTRYQVEFMTGEYHDRQDQANRLRAALYFEGHANSAANPHADYAMCVVSTNASPASIALARRLAQEWGRALDVGGDQDTDIGSGHGVRIGGRGDGNLEHTRMPAVLGEPCFGSNPIQALRAEADEGINTIAEILTAAIRDQFPAGRIIALSVGHIGKPSAPHDRGAAWRGVRFGNEAAFAAAYLHRAAELLRTGT